MLIDFVDAGVCYHVIDFEMTLIAQHISLCMLIYSLFIA